MGNNEREKENFDLKRAKPMFSNKKMFPKSHIQLSVYRLTKLSTAWPTKSLWLILHF